MINVFRAAAVLCALAALSPAAVAQSFPTKPIKLVVPYSAGGLPDVVIRIVSQRAAEGLGQPVLVDNRPGAGGIGATEIVANAVPDGYTLLVSDGSQISINPHLYSKLTVDPTTLAPVSLVGSTPLFLAVNVNSPYRSLSELVAAAKAKPGEMNYGSPGVGSVPHLASEAMKAALGVSIQHVPYKGGSFVSSALLANEITYALLAMSTAAPHLQAGKIRLLAVSAPGRSKLAPDVPTFAEAGIAEFNFQPRVGLLAPAATPQAVMSTLAREFAKAAQHPEIVQKLNALGVDVVGSAPDAFSAVLRADSVRFARIIKTVGAKVD